MVSINPIIANLNGCGLLSLLASANLRPALFATGEASLGIYATPTPAAAPIIPAVVYLIIPCLLFFAGV